MSLSRHLRFVRQTDQAKIDALATRYNLDLTGTPHVLSAVGGLHVLAELPKDDDGYDRRGFVWVARDGRVATAHLGRPFQDLRDVNEWVRQHHSIERAIGALDGHAATQDGQPADGGQRVREIGRMIRDLCAMMTAGDEPVNTLVMRRDLAPVVFSRRDMHATPAPVADAYLPTALNLQAAMGEMIVARGGTLDRVDVTADALVVCADTDGGRLIFGIDPDRPEFQPDYVPPARPMPEWPEPPMMGFDPGL